MDSLWKMSECMKDLDAQSILIRSTCKDVGLRMPELRENVERLKIVRNLGEKGAYEILAAIGVKILRMEEEGEKPKREVPSPHFIRLKPHRRGK